MKTLNLGILAHVDAGKTSLTERLLYAGGAIDRIGSVDEGTTRTDSLALERQRGITIRSAVATLEIGDVTVNIIDTPGHPDFVAEVERVLEVLDGAVLVISAVEGVQAHTRVLMRVLQRLRVPTVIFVNKVDRAGAQQDSLLRSIADRLVPAVVAMNSVSDLGTPGACVVVPDRSDAGFDQRLLDTLAAQDDTLVSAFIGAGRVPRRQLVHALRTQTRSGAVHPVYFGSAITGTGIEPLISALTRFLPVGEPDPGGPLAGRVFKIERGPSGDKIAYVRLFSGSMSVRDRVSLPLGPAVVTVVEAFDPGGAHRTGCLPAGRIGRVWGLTSARIGDNIGDGIATTARPVARHYFSSPTLETLVTTPDPAERGALFKALSQLAEQDPLIGLRFDRGRQNLSVSLYGEVQKEVIESTLAEDFGLAVEFAETTTVCIEQVTGRGDAVELIGTPSNPFLATVGLRVEPADADGTPRFGLDVELGSMPSAFFVAVRETVASTLAQGLHGWQITNAVVTMTHSGYYRRQSHMGAKFDKSMSSTAGDFRMLTPLILMEAVREAGTVVCEPIHRFRLELPADLVGSMASTLPGLDAIPLTTSVGASVAVIEGQVPAARVHTVERMLPSLTRGEGMLETEFDLYRPTRGPAPERPRTDHNPLDRKEYLLHTVRRV